MLKGFVDVLQTREYGNWKASTPRGYFLTRMVSNITRLVAINSLWSEASRRQKIAVVCWFAGSLSKVWVTQYLSTLGTAREPYRLIRWSTELWSSGA